MNEKQLEALNIVKTGQNLFLTGSAGTGKSFTLKSIVNYLENNNINFGLTALTGCAAALISGQTIHSYLYLGISRNVKEIYTNLIKFTPKYNSLKSLETLIIDEVSMMDEELFEVINELLMKIKNNDRPFGGIQLILVGDFYQLPPITGDYCFMSKIWNLLHFNKIILTELIRQKDDNVLQKLLEEIRQNKPSENTLSILTELTKKPNYKEGDIMPTRLYPVNTNVIKINNYEFKKLVKKNNGETKTYEAYSTKKNEKLTDYHITLTLHAQVMVIRNISVEDKLVNGTRGIIIKLNPTNVIIKDINNNIHTINYFNDFNKNNKKPPIISFMPLKLAYAMSIHKAQGASIDVLEIDLGDDIFISGQLYTALSRATNINSIKITNFSKDSFMLNKKVKNFYENI